MHVDVDGTRCAAYGLCAETAPQLFELDDFGYAVTNGEPVPPELRDSAREAVEACPAEAIRLLTDPAERSTR